MEDYPLFVAPAELVPRTPREWSKSEADTYCAWQKQVLDQRIRGMFDYFGLDGVGEPRAVLRRLGDAAAAALMSAPFSEHGKLTDHGFALAADLGLLVAKYLLAARGDRVHWEVVRRPKSDWSFNQPVLVGFGKVYLNPVGGSIGEAFGIIAGRRNSGSDAWLRSYDTWLAKVV